MKDFETLFIRDTSSGITYFFKGYTSGQIQKDNTLTTYATVEGTPMTDYSYPNLRTVTIGLQVSDLNKDGGYYYYRNGVYYSNGIESLIELLDSWRINATLLTIQTREERFENMCIRTVSNTEGDDNKGSYEPNITFQEFRRVVIKTAMLGPFISSEERAGSVQEDSAGRDSGTASSALGETIGSALPGAAIGAGIGMGIGSIIPGIGTAVGGFVGGAIGAFVGLITSDTASMERAQSNYVNNILHMGEYFGWYSK